MTNSSAVGILAQATGISSTSIGAFSDATKTNSSALGFNAQATAINSVALGANSVANIANTVSVGAVGSERQIERRTRWIVDLEVYADDERAMGVLQVANPRAVAGRIPVRSGGGARDRGRRDWRRRARVLGGGAQLWCLGGALIEQNDLRAVCSLCT